VPSDGRYIVFVAYVICQAVFLGCVCFCGCICLSKFFSNCLLPEKNIKLMLLGAF
jgi:hypothetical protein